LRDWWADATGSKDYIDRAFIYARQADPDSVLILNDFGNEGINTVSDEMYDYIKDAKTRDIPIDAIGMQMHIDGRHPPTKDEVITNMNRFGEIGIDVYVTEFDVNMNDVLTDAEGKNAIQGDIYYEMARACIESSACKSFALLGITDKETWYNYIGLDDPRPLPFDVNYRPKPAFEKLLKAFSEAS
jgi:endo-1,4-beta-xylanase